MRDTRLVRNTGLSFAIAGTGMHLLNIASATPPQVSHAWSAIAIIGFFLTSLSQLKENLLSRLARKVGQKTRKAIMQQVKNDDVALP